MPSFAFLLLSLCYHIIFLKVIVIEVVEPLGITDFQSRLNMQLALMPKGYEFFCKHLLGTVVILD